MAADHATIAEEEYLQIMFWLEEAGLPITGANIARAMQLSPPTVHEMIGRLEKDGYVTRKPDKSLDFTANGREEARADRPAPPPDRALPHRRAADPLGRGPRGGRADGARDVAGARGAHARRDRRRDDLPARPSDRRGRPRARRAAGRRRARRRRPRAALRERGGGDPPLPQGHRHPPGPRRQARPRRRATRSSSPPTTAPTWSPATSPRPSPSAPTRRPLPARRCPSSSWSRATATAARPVTVP